MTKAHLQATILVADDDTAIRTNLRLLLQSEGYRVLEAADGLQAAQAFGDPSVALAFARPQDAGAGRHEPVAQAPGSAGGDACHRYHRLGWQRRCHRGHETRSLRLHYQAVRPRRSSLHRTAGLDTEGTGRPGGSTDDCSAGRCRLL